MDNYRRGVYDYKLQTNRPVWTVSQASVEKLQVLFIPTLGAWQPADCTVITLPCKATSILPQTPDCYDSLQNVRKRILVWQQRLAEWMADTAKGLEKPSSQHCTTTILLCDQMRLCSLTMRSCLFMAHACSTHTQKPSQRGVFIDSNIHPAVNT